MQNDTSPKKETEMSAGDKPAPHKLRAFSGAFFKKFFTYFKRRGKTIRSLRTANAETAKTRAEALSVRCGRGSKISSDASAQSAPPKRYLIKILCVQLAVSAVIFGALMIIKSIENPGVKKAYETVIKAFSYNIPVAGDEDDDIGKIKFVDKIKEKAVAADTAPVEIVLPADAILIDGAAGVFTIYTLPRAMVTACERGLVTATGYVSGKRYIEILHPGGVKSRVQGALTAGVKVNESIKKGQYIAAAGADGTLTFLLLRDNAPIASAAFTEDRFQW